MAYDRSRFFLTIVEDLSRCTWTYMLKAKSDAKHCLQSFYTLAETQYNTKIKIIRVIMGWNFTSLIFTLQREIIHQHTCVETPQQNGIVERKHQHILQVARSLKFQSSLSLKYWTDCIMTATYLINCILTPLLHNKPPFFSRISQPMPI